MVGRKSRRSIESDVLSLLHYVYKHRDDAQSYTQLSEATGIPRMSLTQLIKWTCSWRRDDGRLVTVCGPECIHSHAVTDWALYNYGLKYGYRVKFIGRRGQIIDVDRVELQDYIPDYYRLDYFTYSHLRQERTMQDDGPGDGQDIVDIDLGECFLWQQSTSERYLSTASERDPEALYARIAEVPWHRNPAASSAMDVVGRSASSSI